MNTELSNVGRVYSGKPGCMCGCNGIYSRTSVCKEPSSSDSYTRVSDRSVKIIYNKVMKNPSVKFQDNIAYVESGTRVLAVYFNEEG